MKETRWEEIRRLFEETRALVVDAAFDDFDEHWILKDKLNELANEMARYSGAQAQDLMALKGMIIKLIIAQTGIYNYKYQDALMDNLRTSIEHSWPTIDEIKIVPDDWAEATIRMMEECGAGKSQVTVRIEKENGRRYQAGTYIRRIR